MTAPYSETVPTKPGHYVYRLWAADGTCLYVGLVGEVRAQYLQNRLSKHRRMKPWWHQVTRVDVAKLDGPAETIQEERSQIAKLSPAYNKLLLAKCVNGHDKTPENTRITGTCVQCDIDRKKTPEAKVRNLLNQRRYRTTARAQVSIARYNQKRRLKRWAPPPNQQGLW